MSKRPIKLKVASPCQADWDAMTGDEAKRFCGACKQDVYQLSNMSTEQVEELLATNKGLRICGRFYQRADGTILTKDCSVGVSKKRKRRVVKLVGAAALSASAVGIGLRSQSSSPAKPAKPVMGQLATDPVPSPESIPVPTTPEPETTEPEEPIPVMGELIYEEPVEEKPIPVMGKIRRVEIEE